MLYNRGSPNLEDSAVYQLTTKETVSNGIKRVAQEELDRAIAQLSGQTEESHEEAIHDARKRLKKLRALLRLVRDRLGQDAYERENLCFRDAARKLSDCAMPRCTWNPGLVAGRGC
ncbi:MAG: CHAD domain-containing protein [Coleofasciculaceae cyanobacterium SM2_3_26]|nr:CHAD domain-containing protein [Coleofasciculaceae cyanobacterium SM2_3_26]